MKCLAVLLAIAALFTLAASPRIKRAIIHYSEYSLPKPDYVGPRYFVNGKYVGLQGWPTSTERTDA